MHVIPKEELDLPWEQRDPKFFGSLTCDIEAAQRLRHCKSPEDVEAWNAWLQAERNADRTVHVQGIDLSHAQLDRIDLVYVHLELAKLVHAQLNYSSLEHAHLDYAELGFAQMQEASLKSAKMGHTNFSFANLEKANLDLSNLNHANLCSACLDHAVLRSANLEHAQLIAAHLNHADLWSAHMEYTKLKGAALDYANLDFTRLDHADLWNTDAKHAGFKAAHLEFARLTGAHLEHASFTSAYVNEKTEFTGCHVDKETDFRNVALDTIRIDVETKALLRYNMRRMAWEEWYNEAGLKWPKRKARQGIQLFWESSDYGRSSSKLFATFIQCTAFFAVLYFVWAAIEYFMGADDPGIIHGLVTVPLTSLKGWWMLAWRSFYFSVVTMTTLGFGDMHADPESVLAHVVLCIHVLIGFLLLGSLISVLGTYISSEAGPIHFPDEIEEGCYFTTLKKKLLRRGGKKKVS